MCSTSSVGEGALGDDTLMAEVAIARRELASLKDELRSRDEKARTAPMKEQDQYA